MAFFLHIARRRDFGGLVRDQGSPFVALVVDDEYLIAIELESMLSAAGFQVLSAVNVAEARSLTANTPVHVAVLDFRMGDGALDLARDLKAQGVPLVFCTGSMVEEVHAVFPDASVISKPFIAELVLSTVTAALEQASVARD